MFNLIKLGFMVPFFLFYFVYIFFLSIVNVDNIFYKFLELFFIPLFVIFVYNFITFKRFFDNLCNEIDENFLKIQDNQISLQLSRMREIHEEILRNRNHIEWVGFGKTISVWTFIQKSDRSPTDYYRYLTNNDLKNFIQNGYYHYIKPFEENLTLFYLSCENMSIETQDIEKEIIVNQEQFFLHYLTQQTNEYRQQNLEDKIHDIVNTESNYKPSINQFYSKIHPYFEKDFLYVLKLYLCQKT